MEHVDIAIVGGGFSGLAVLANLVREAPGPVSIAVISRDPPETFGPAYSTPRPEHLLNIRAEGMGLFAGHPCGFFEWAREKNSAAGPGNYLPRRLYAEYLRSILRDTRELAVKKNITLRFLRAEIEDIEQAEGSLRIAPDVATARNVVLAIGNSLKAETTRHRDARLVRDPWAYDYAALAGKTGKIALIGGGLTALDALVSILASGWQGRVFCFSRSGLLPEAHP